MRNQYFEGLISVFFKDLFTHFKGSELSNVRQTKNIFGIYPEPAII